MFGKKRFIQCFGKPVGEEPAAESGLISSILFLQKCNAEGEEDDKSERGRVNIHNLHNNAFICDKSISTLTAFMLRK
jgi:hypothetical protein